MCPFADSHISIDPHWQLFHGLITASYGWFKPRQHYYLLAVGAINICLYLIKTLFGVLVDNVTGLETRAG
jgi:hypothetical protein